MTTLGVDPWSVGGQRAALLDDATPERQRVAWLARRVGFGPAPGELDQAEARGAAAQLDRLLDPDTAGIPHPPDPWDDAAFPVGENSRPLTVAAVDGWLERWRTTPRPLEDWMAWYWHGHLVSALSGGVTAALMIRQVRTFWRHGLGTFPELLRAVTTDAAMLVYLDGNRNRRGRPNENYARELMELFGLGLGAFTEADVAAAAVALTGWRVDRETGAVSFEGRLHDDTPQVLLGRSGVRDVDGVIAAVCDHPACAPFVTGRLARALLGPGVDDGLVKDLAKGFAASGLAIRPLVRSILEAGLSGAAGTLVWGPAPWLVAAQRATGASLEAQARVNGLRAVGHQPFSPPNVAGWPGGNAWLAAGTVVSRVNLASAVAMATPPDAPARRAAQVGDWAGLADLLGRPEGFAPTTVAALGGLPAGDGAGRLALALAAPDHVLA